MRACHGRGVQCSCVWIGAVGSRGNSGEHADRTVDTDIPGWMVTKCVPPCRALERLTSPLHV